MKRCTTALLIVSACALSGCALTSHYLDVPRITAEVAVKQIGSGGATLLDVRAPQERVGREIARSIRVQFGADRWGSAIGELEGERFLLAVARVADKTDEVLVICNQEVRSAAAVRLLRFNGYLNASSIAGGYMGTHGEPGWYFFEELSP